MVPPPRGRVEHRDGRPARLRALAMHAVDRWRVAGADGPARAPVAGRARAARCVYDAVQRIARAAELRCGPVDWTRPVPGWVLFG